MNERHPIEIFYSYAQADEDLRQELENHLSHLVQEHQITAWHQQKIIPGQSRTQQIDAHLNTAQIILLLVSSDFLASDYCYSREMRSALERHQAQQACVIPVLLRPVDWQNTPFADLGPLPSNHQPVTSWSNQDAALVNVVQGIRRAIEHLKTTTISQSPQEIQQMQQPTNPPSVIDGLDRPATVFLSYAREDIDAVKDIQLRLKVRGIRCWRDVDDLPVGSHTESEIKHAIELDADAIALFLTPSFLQSDFIWRVEVPAALRRQKDDPHFHIVPILSGVSFAEVRKFCYNRHLTDLAGFNGLLLSGDGVALTREEENKMRNEAARRILQSAFALRLRRINADRNYEATISLKTFPDTPPTTRLDLNLDWLDLIYKKERLSTHQEWEDILFPALNDVKEMISEMVPAHRIHLYVKSILPVGITLGFVFRRTAKITLLVEGQKETWSTETAPSENEPLCLQWNHHDQGDQQIAVVEVATTRMISKSVEEALSLYGLTPGFHIQLDVPVPSDTSVGDAATARAMARQVGQICQRLCDEYRVRHIHLFVALPVQLAILIGHQLSALCPITLYEFKSEEKVYQPIWTIRK